MGIEISGRRSRLGGFVINNGFLDYNNLSKETAL